MYKPYIGGAGPTKEQAAENTTHLFEMLTQAGVPCTMDNGEYAKDTWGGDEKMIVMEGGIVRVSYDRWGFCADGISDIDQWGLEETFNALKAPYFPQA